MEAEKYTSLSYFTTSYICIFFEIHRISCTFGHYGDFWGFRIFWVFWVFWKSYAFWAFGKFDFEVLLWFLSNFWNFWDFLGSWRFSGILGIAQILGIFEIPGFFWGCLGYLGYLFFFGIFGILRISFWIHEILSKKCTEILFQVIHPLGNFLSHYFLSFFHLLN